MKTLHGLMILVDLMVATQQVVQVCCVVPKSDAKGVVTSIAADTESIDLSEVGSSKASIAIP